MTQERTQERLAAMALQWLCRDGVYTLIAPELGWPLELGAIALVPLWLRLTRARRLEETWPGEGRLVIEQLALPWPRRPRYVVTYTAAEGRALLLRPGPVRVIFARAVDALRYALVAYGLGVGGPMAGLPRPPLNMSGAGRQEEETAT